jgi:small subunit ribosomal protein S4
MKLFLKGERCHSEKCAVDRRNFVPGQHGKDRRAKLKGYGLELREKQKVRLGTSHPQCRQLVRHGHIQVNGRKVNIPSYVVRPNDLIEVRQESRNNPTILAARDATAHAPTPNWLEVDREALRGRVVGMPKRGDLVQLQVNERLIVELYSK